MLVGRYRRGFPRRRGNGSLNSTVYHLSISLTVLAMAAACHSPEPVVLKADAIRRGDDLVRQQRYVEAASAYQDAVKQDPADAGLRLKLADAHRRANQWADFVSEATIAADLQPDNREAQMQAVAGLISESAFDAAADRISPGTEERARQRARARTVC